MKLGIYTVSNRDHKPQFTQSLADMLVYTVMRREQIGLKDLSFNAGINHSSLPRGRQGVLKTATAKGYSHVLLIDDDMTYPPNTIELLASRKLLAIGANCVGKSNQLNFTARGLDKQVIDSRGKTGVEEVARVGVAMFLLDLSVLNNIPAPHFEMPWSGDDYLGESDFFCDKLRAHGIKIHIDHDLSQKMGHAGDMIYTLNGFSGT